MIVWRLSRAIFQDLSGIGGLKYSGRWNEAGLPVVYASENMALSVLERRVHSVQRPEDDVCIQIEVPDDSISSIPLLPNFWREDLRLTRSIGSEWLRSKRSVSLRVPSAIVEGFNYLINPLHPDIPLVKIISVEPFKYDPRLFR